MPEDTFSYQFLMDAVIAATDARGSVYPNDYSYVALPLDTVKSIVASFDPETCSTEARKSHNQARRLWYRFKENSPHCACGIVRLMSPVPNDLVGIVTSEDLRGTSNETLSSKPSLNREMLSDDLSELHDVPAFIPIRSVQPGAERLARPTRSPWKPQESPESSPKAEIEMTLIDPQKKEIFKRSQGGVFGEGNWPVSEIKAFAVWF